jgi:hypothetical protein
VAVENDAVWCDLVCRSRKITTSWQKGFWVSRQPTPRLYPGGITLEEHVPPERLVDELPPGICSVKDSYADLDLASRGFERLFDASWIYRTPKAYPAPPSGWTVVRAEQGLVRWLEASGLGDVLPPALLRDASVQFLQNERASGLSAGAVLNRTGSVVGVSNVFSTRVPLDEVWTDVSALAGYHFPSCPIVGYERGEYLDAATGVGFHDLAPLRVWLRNPGGRS